MSSIVSKRIKINDYNIHYQEAGTGSTVLLLFPGAIGGAAIDFQLQLTHLAGDEIRVIAWDPPGLGHSIPPLRQLPENYRERDASLAADLVKALGIKKVSVGGYSDGGTIALIMAAQHPDLVEKVITWGSRVSITQKEFEFFQLLQSDLTQWNQSILKAFTDFHGEKYVLETYSKLVDSYENALRNKNGDICTEIVPHIKCPAMILHGVCDKSIALEQPLYLRQHIPNSILVNFSDGKHNLHVGITQTFNKVVKDFLLGKLVNDKTI